MTLVQEEKIYCPYCGEPITLLVDCSVEQQSYIEDCQVCCRPISLQIYVDNLGIPQVTARHENE